MNTKLTFFLCFLFCVGAVFSQTRGINYKAVIADNNGAPLVNQAVTVQFTILEGSMATNEVYKESHTTTTKANGIIIVNIGEGVNVSGDFQTINWGFDTHFVKTEVDTGSGFVDFGTTEFKTVPYALHAETVSSTGNVSAFSESIPNRITATNTNADFVIGSTNTEDENNINLDSRLFFDKTKAAFRVGAVDGTQWNNANRGLYSFAGGRNNTANGVASTVFGVNNQVSGSNSLALGSQNTVNGSNSLVAGSGNISSNQINAQTVLGKWNEVETDALLIVGNGTDDSDRKNILSVKSNGNIIANDLDVAEITQSNALVTKAYVDANTGTTSTGLEQLDEGNGNGWRLIGKNSNNYGAIGLNSVDFSTNLNPSTTSGATGEEATAFGFNTTASGNRAFASGDRTRATGFVSTAMGLRSEASGLYSTALGWDTTASNLASTALGDNTIASGRGSTAVGSYNADDSNAKFMVGNGGLNNRKTAFKVMNTGVVNIDNLTGTGTRNVSVDASGNLLATTTEESDILVITPFDFNKEDITGGITMTRHRIDGAYIDVPGDVSEIYAPVQFPKDAVITSVEFIYTDFNTTSGRSLEFSIGFQQFDTSTNGTQAFFVAGTNLNTDSYAPANRIAVANNIDFPISGFNTNLYRAYYVRIKPVSGGSWSGTSDTAIKQVRIHYSH